MFTENYKYSFIHLVVCLTTGPKPLPKPALLYVYKRKILTEKEATSFIEKIMLGNFLFVKERDPPL
jgi:hypothetical protein